MFESILDFFQNLTGDRPENEFAPDDRVLPLQVSVSR